MSASFLRSHRRGRILLATLLVFSMAICVGSALATDNRVDRRAAEMPLPDPYLDPAWPDDQPGDDGLGRHYEAGDADNVDDVPLDDDDSQADQRALEALTGDAPARPADPELPAQPVPPAAAAAPDEAPAPDSPTALRDDQAEPRSDEDDRDPVEW